jgi:hypothetical protein
MESTVYLEDTTGYTIRVNAYTEDEFTTILQAASTLFEQKGLGRPTSFRAGGWTADLGTMRAMARAGYTVETSAVSWKYLQPYWEHVPLAPNATLYQWNMMHWASIDDTSQPYYPNQTDILSSMAPNLTVLQVPDNACLADYTTAMQIQDVFAKNLALNALPGGALAKPTMFQTGFHPPSLGTQYFANLDGGLAAVDPHLYDDDKGPVVYARISDLTKVWPRP